MEDSFFGFDSSAPVEDDGGGERREGAEEEYDALNAETFGAAINGDWENIHENLVRLDGLNGSGDKDDDECSDLGINLSRVKLDDVVIASDDNESRIQLDPSVWANPIKPETHPNPHNNLYSNPEAFLRHHFPKPFDNNPQQPQRPNRIFGLPAPPASVPHKICTVEDIERNIRNQQQLRVAIPKTKTQTPLSNLQLSTSQSNANFLNRSVAPPPPPGFNTTRTNFNLPQHALNMHQVHRMPPGFPPMPPMIGSHVLPAAPHHTTFSRTIPPHNLPIALNNFAMHPNFNAMRPMGPSIIPSRLPIMHTAMMQGMPAAVNQFNQRLVQEIQQNHPMLANIRGFNHLFISNNSHNQISQNQFHHMQKMNGKLNMRSNGNLEEYDEYSNLMSARDKHWLIGIQLSQLNTDTPYIDDYYYTVYRDRKAKLNGDSLSKAHKDNQLNHPLIQPKGHAQLVLISMGKNGSNVRNGQNRERKNSESKSDKDQVQRTHTPLQFENSLGKLQYGSVTAPRKIIDMDVMGNESSPQFNTSIELSAQRKSRQILLHIETLYRILLKLEDLENPAAISTFAVIKEKKEREKQHVFEQAMIDEMVNKNEKAPENPISSDFLLSSMNDKLPIEIESRDKLICKLLPLLTIDKIIGMMNVRKGKTLIRRIMPLIEDNPIRWSVWCGIFSSLQNVLKKDKDDADGILFALYPQFKKQIKNADLKEVINVANSMPLNDKKLNSLFACKFCISSLVAILLRAEEIYSITNVDKLLNTEWSQLLSLLSTSLSRTIQHQTISAAVESNAIKPMVHHFSRFKELKLDSLLALFSQAEQHLN